MYLYPLGIDGKTPNELVVGVALVDACRWPLEAKQKWQALDQKNQMLVSHGDEWETFNRDGSVYRWALCNTREQRERLIINDTLHLSLTLTVHADAVVPPPVQFQQDIKALLDTGAHSDVVMMIEDEKVEIPVHKAILSARSPVFKAMFHHDMQESGTGKIVIKDVSVSAMRWALTYLYTSDVSLPTDAGPAELLLVADRFQLTELQKSCVNQIVEQLSDKTLVDCLLLGDQLPMTGLWDHALDFLCVDKARWPDLLASEDVQRLDRDQLLKISRHVHPSKKHARQDDPDLNESATKKARPTA